MDFLYLRVYIYYNNDTGIANEQRHTKYRYQFFNRLRYRYRTEITQKGFRGGKVILSRPSRE